MDLIWPLPDALACKEWTDDSGRYYRVSNAGLSLSKIGD